MCEVVRKVVLEQEIKETKNMPVNENILEMVYPSAIYEMRKWKDCRVVVKHTMFPIPGIVQFDKWVKDEKDNFIKVDPGREMAENLFHSLFIKKSNN